MKIALIDNHALFRNGLSALLARHNINTISFESGKQALIGLANNKVDIILLDMRMPELSGLETLITIKKQKINLAPIVMLTTSTDETDLKQCLQHGAAGYLLKDMHPDELVKALNDTLSGNIVVAKDMTQTLAKILKNELDDTPNTMNKLTPREKQVACLIANGLNNKLIARELTISDGTVKLHVKSILKKLGLHSRVEVAVAMIEGGFCK